MSKQNWFQDVFLKGFDELFEKYDKVYISDKQAEICMSYNNMMKGTKYFTYFGYQIHEPLDYYTCGTHIMIELPEPKEMGGNVKRYALIDERKDFNEKRKENRKKYIKDHKLKD